MDAISPGEAELGLWPARAFVALRALSWVAIVLMGAAALFALWSALVNWAFIVV